MCWDALDGSTLYELLENKDLPTSIDNAIRLLMGFWYLSVGGRVAVMFLTHLTPTSRGYNFVLPPPLALDPQPTVDRTLQGLRLRYILCQFTMRAPLAKYFFVVISNYCDY